MEPAPIVQKSYTFALWLLRKVESLPRSHRFTLGDRITVTARRAEPLQRSQRHLNTLRFPVRMTRDLKSPHR